VAGWINKLAMRELWKRLQVPAVVPPNDNGDAA
jgi:hypothetical protein